MLTPGQRISGRYRLGTPLGSGGMSDVWAATDEVLARPVAVKVIRPVLLAQGGFAQRFATEARILAGLRHPGIVAVYDYGEDGELAYLVMELVAGQSLANILADRGTLGPQSTMRVVAEAAAALAAAHAVGVVHRDVKPGNLLLRADDGSAVLVDFGIATSAGSAGLTEPGTVLGTALYMAPEQATRGTITSAVDVYALGALAYHCLAGAPPFTGDNPVALAYRHAYEDPPALPASVPPGVREVVERALAKDPDDRYPDAMALAEAARNATTAAVSGTTAVLPAVPRRPRKKHVVAAGSAVAAVAVGAILLAASPMGTSSPGGTTPSAPTTHTPGTGKPVLVRTTERPTGHATTSATPSAGASTSAQASQAPSQAPASPSAAPAPSLSTQPAEPPSSDPSPAAAGSTAP